MNCPLCGNECRKGIIEAKDARSITQLFTMVSWYPEDEKGKLLRKGSVMLELSGEGW